MKQWFNAKREKGSKVGTVRIYDQIGDSWFGDSTSAKSFTTAVDELGDDLETLNIHINSPGGNVYDGLAIYNYLMRHPADVVVYVDGVAASIASIIAMAGDRIIMPENTAMFIHNPWSVAIGDANAMRKSADDLDAMKGSLLGVYMTRANLEADEVEAMMDAETLLTAEEAVEWGFADELEEASRAAANTNPTTTAALAKVRMEYEMRERSMQAKLDKLQERNEELEAEVDFLAEDLEEFTNPAPAMEASALLKHVSEASAPDWLGKKLVLDAASEKSVDAALEEFSSLRDACAAAGVSEESFDAACREHWGDRPALVSALMVEAMAQVEEETHNRQKPGPSSAARDMPNIDDVYAKRRKAH